jgi:hypothetical protein
MPIIDINDLQILSRVVGVIMSAPARRIDFTLGRIPVNYDGFCLVFNELVTHRIGVTTEGIPPDAEAAYDSVGDMYLIPRRSYGQTPEERMSLVHESVHALQDIRGAVAYGAWGAALPADSEDEAAAFIAGALYYYYETGTFLDCGGDTGDIFNKASEIAGQVVRGRTTVSDMDQNELRTLIASAGVYRRIGVTYTSRVYVSDGIADRKLEISSGSLRFMY